MVSSIKQKEPGAPALASSIYTRREVYIGGSYSQRMVGVADENLNAIVWLYRGETEKYTELLSNTMPPLAVINRSMCWYMNLEKGMKLSGQKQRRLWKKLKNVKKRKYRESTNIKIAELDEILTTLKKLAGSENSAKVNMNYRGAVQSFRYLWDRRKRLVSPRGHTSVSEHVCGDGVNFSGAWQKSMMSCCPCRRSPTSWWLLSRRIWGLWGYELEEIRNLENLLGFKGMIWQGAVYWPYPVADSTSAMGFSQRI